MIKNIVMDLQRGAKTEKRNTSDINGIALHHAGGPGNPYTWAPYHIQKFGSGLIGYGMVVMRDGTVLKTANDSDRTPGVANHNWHVVSICFEGDFTKEPITLEQINGGLEAIRHYRVGYTIPLDNVKGHGEWADPGFETSCPGINLGFLFRTLLQLKGDSLWLASSPSSGVARSSK